MPRRKTSTAPVIAGVGFGVALGVFVGALGLGPVVAGGGLADGIGGQGSESVREQYRRAMQDKQVLDAQMSSGDAVINDLAPTTVDGTLVGRPVLVIKTSNAQESDVKAIQKLLKSSDMDDAGIIDLSDSFFHQENADKLKSLLANTLPAGAQLSTSAMDAGTHAGEALGAALFLDPKTTQPLATVDDRGTLLKTLRDKGFIKYKDGTILPAQAILIIDGKTDGEGTSAYKSTNLAAFVKGLNSVGKHTVLAARVESAAENGPLTALRDDEKNEVTTVDSIDRSWARMATVLAIREQLDGHHGAYGSAASADAACPPVPEV